MQPMKPFNYVIVFALSAAVLPTTALAVPKEPDYFCYMRTASGRSLDLTGLCNGSKNASAFAEKGKTAPLLLYVTRISRSSRYIAVDGYITNQTNQEQEVGSFDYKLWNQVTKQYVVISSSSVNKTIPPYGRVSFLAVVDKEDVNGASPRDLSLELVKFN